jgi:hypothetical protein
MKKILQKIQRKIQKYQYNKDYILKRNTLVKKKNKKKKKKV